MPATKRRIHHFGDAVSVAQFALLEQRVGGIELKLDKLTSTIDSWITSRQTNPWKVVALILGIIVPLGFILNLYITTAIAPVSSTATEARTIARANQDIMGRIVEDMSTVKAENSDSKRNREDLGTNQARIVDALTSLQTKFAGSDSERRANEREVETQVDAMNQSLSIQFANQQRHNSDVQNALHEFGATVPQAPDGPWFFPNISNRNHRTMEH